MEIERSGWEKRFHGVVRSIVDTRRDAAAPESTVKIFYCERIPAVSGFFCLAAVDAELAVKVHRNGLQATGYGRHGYWELRIPTRWKRVVARRCIPSTGWPGSLSITGSKLQLKRCFDHHETRLIESLWLVLDDPWRGRYCLSDAHLCQYDISPLNQVQRQCKAGILRWNLYWN